MKKTVLLASVGAMLGTMTISAEIDCLQLAASVKAAVAAEQSQVLEIVAKEVSAAPACACEVVKAAIEGSRADASTVAAIVETAIHASPENMRLISQCAIAMAPDALVEVQTVLAKLDPNSGESGQSAKSAKSAKSGKEPVGEVAAMPNPLDFPGKGPVKPLYPLFPPIIINPPDVTNVNFQLVAPEGS